MSVSAIAASCRRDGPAAGGLGRRLWARPRGAGGPPSAGGCTRGLGGKVPVSARGLRASASAAAWRRHAAWAEASAPVWRRSIRPVLGPGRRCSTASPSPTPAKSGSPRAEKHDGRTWSRLRWRAPRRHRPQDATENFQAGVADVNSMSCSPLDRTRRIDCTRPTPRTVCLLLAAPRAHRISKASEPMSVRTPSADLRVNPI